MSSSYLDSLSEKDVPHAAGSESPALVSSKDTSKSSSSNLEFMLINRGYGSFRYSDEFEQELSHRGFSGDASSDRSHPLVITLV